MKIILIMALSFLSGCATINEAINEVSTPASSDQTMAKKKPLAWGNSHADWDKYIYAALDKAPSISNAKNICKTLNHKDCLAQTISKMAQYESNYKPATFYPECNKTKCVYSDGCNKVPDYGYCMKGNPKYDNGLVISAGLMQISTSSAISYGCDIKSKTDLQDPKKNLECAVKIATKWIAQDKVFYKDDTKLGLARYWSVMRSTSGSKPKILEYLKAF